MNELETLVLQYIGENTTSPDVFTEANIGPIRDSINDAIEEVSMLSGGYKEKYVIPLYQGQMFWRLKFSRGQFAFITDCWLVNSKFRLTQKSLIEIASNNPYWMKDSGTPVHYIPVGMNLVGVWPKPSSSGNALELDCAVIPARYTADTDRLKLVEVYKKSVVHYAISEFFASRGDANEAAKHFQIYAKALGLDTQHTLHAGRIREFHGSLRPADENQTLSARSE